MSESEEKEMREKKGGGVSYKRCSEFSDEILDYFLRFWGGGGRGSSRKIERRERFYERRTFQLVMLFSIVFDDFEKGERKEKGERGRRKEKDMRKGGIAKKG